MPNQLEFIAVSDLIPYAANARTHSETQIAQISQSIEEFGFTNPVLIAADNTIIAGHGRVMAAKAMGMATVPCFRLAHLSDEQRRAYIIADNKLALNAGWDEELLKLELGELRDGGFDLRLTGFDASEIDALFLDEENLEEEGLTGDDDAPGLGGSFVSQLGDVWVLGDHRVMCGDSTLLSHVEKLCGDDPVDCCWTDPPYNVNYESKAGKIQNDHMGDGAFREFLRDAFVSAFAVMRAGAPIYVAHADTEGFNFRGAFLEAGFKLSGCLIWVKPALVLGRSDYQWRHEPILYGWKEGAAHSWHGGRKNTTVVDAEDMPFLVEGDGAAVQIEIGESTLRISGADLHVEELVGSVIRAEKPKKSAEHPTMKPVGLILGMLKNSSRRGDTVLDLFGGSGSTLIACQKVGRRARLMEFDPKYADVIVRRWQEFSGLKAKLAETGELFDAVAAKRQKVVEDA
ncbi:site-specific DNA-methyltransferase [Roseovarius sp. D0-M9]|uniref:site-specific DNA-methyltransferase n=1 Tax=Roseovarius sp. D0-M9 TaxID=3127117 RepID=UPI00300FF16F